MEGNNPLNKGRTDTRRSGAKLGGILDLRSEAELERRRERARALAKQAVGMQAARSGARPVARPAADGLTRQERAAQRQAAAKVERAAGLTDQNQPQAIAPSPAAAPAAPARTHTEPLALGHHKSDPALASASAPGSDLGAKSDLPPRSDAATDAPKRPAAAKRAPGATKKTGIKRVLSLAQYPLIAIVALAAAYSSTVGQWLILAYAIFALVRRIDSRYSFGAALFLLVTIPLFSALGQSGIAQTVAIYVYELLVVGTIQAVIELRKTGISTS